MSAASSTPYTFNFNGTELRTIEIEGALWFVAADVCRCLGLQAHPSNGGYSSHLSRVDCDEKRVTLVADAPTTQDGRCAGKRRQTVVAESGLYKLVLRSDKAEAQAFKNWVTQDVLPSIRKTGGYLLNENARETAHADTREAMPLPEGIAEGSLSAKSGKKALAPIDHEGNPMIDARALHGWLGSGDRFDQWLRRRCREYGFAEGEDFYPHKFVLIDGAKPHHRRKDYLLTLDMAKELAMVERTEVGRETRRYFIRMERAAVQMANDHVARGTPEAIPQAPVCHRWRAAGNGGLLASAN